uniref:Uncharacterized protein n=1 Tax=Anguilla anguilla TaxID=7936 RepID=A0A0E9X0X8_ANGAN
MKNTLLRSCFKIAYLCHLYLKSEMPLLNTVEQCCWISGTLASKSLFLKRTISVLRGLEIWYIPGGGKQETSHPK